MSENDTYTPVFPSSASRGIYRIHTVKPDEVSEAGSTSKTGYVPKPTIIDSSRPFSADSNTKHFLRLICRDGPVAACVNPIRPVLGHPLWEIHTKAFGHSMQAYAKTPLSELCSEKVWKDALTCSLYHP